MKPESTRWAAIGLAVVLSGCASFETRRGIDETAALVTTRGETAPAAAVQSCTDPQSAVMLLTAQALTAEAAVQIALQCNPVLAAGYARLGIANAEAFEAGRLANPSVSFGAMDSNAAEGGTQLSLGITQNFTNLILRGPRTRLAEGEFLRAQQLLAGEVLGIAAEVKSAHARRVAAQQIALVRAAIAEATDAAGELARRFHSAGNISARELALAEATGVDAAIAAREADDEVAAAQSDLHRLLGLDATLTWSIIDTLPMPVAEEEGVVDLRTRADSERLDLAAARKRVELLADSARTNKRLGWLGEFEAGIDYEREPDHSRMLGPTLSIQLPLFHQGQGSKARATSLHAWSEAERRRLSIDVGSAVELTARRVRNARARVDDHRERLLPLRTAVVARTQEEVNFMLRGVFELIDARVAEYAAVQGYIVALRDYWIARADLERAVGARLPASASVLPAVSANDLLRTTQTAAGIDHSKMDHSKMDHSKMDHSKMDHSRHGERMQAPVKPATPTARDAQPAAHKHDTTNNGEQP